RTNSPSGHRNQYLSGDSPRGASFRILTGREPTSLRISTGREPPSFCICSRNSLFLEHIQISEKIRM
ncbi:MAG: hypothetical protein K2M39_06960, partial [Muribaculaceae bacterium]|nr:hypothetical protein [Muribaculaceae bacterium]